MQTAMYALGLPRYSHDYCVDVIDKLFRETSPDVFEEKQGCHVNIAAIIPLPDELVPYQIFPATPDRSF